MNKLIISLVLVSFICGCATNIASLKVTQRDQEVYDNPYLKKQADKEQVSALRVAIVPESKNQADPIGEKLSGIFYDGIDTAFSSLKDFQSVPRAEIGAIIKDDAITSLTADKNKDYKIASVDYLLIYKIQNYSMKKTSTMLDNGKSKSFHGVISAKVSLINSKENIKEFTKTISGESSSSSDSEATNAARSQEVLSDAVKVAVNDFVTQFAVDYAPPAVVQQTKGDGKVALLNVGQKNGVMKKMKVEFYTIKLKDDKKIIIPFAYGKVIEVDEESCWTEIDDYDTAGVHENHFARVRKDQSKSFFENISENMSK